MFKIKKIRNAPFLLEKELSKEDESCFNKDRIFKDWYQPLFDGFVSEAHRIKSNWRNDGIETLLESLRRFK